MILGKVVSYRVTIYINRKTLERHVVNCFILLNPLFPKHVLPENPIYLVILISVKIRLRNVVKDFKIRMDFKENG